VNAFPLTAEPFPGNLQGRPVARTQSASLFSVLLVEDDESARVKYGLALTAARFLVMHAADGLEALNAATEYLPDAIVTGMQVPKIDGLSLVSCLQATLRTAAIPVIVLTADVHTRTSAAGGAAVFLSDPCPPDVLVSEVSRLIDVAHPLYPRGPARQIEHARLHECTKRLSQNHAALRPDRAAFDVLNHHRHLDELRKHLAALATHKLRLRKARHNARTVSLEGVRFV
jgi:two-component system chemotaxis response regulator CheY